MRRHKDMKAQSTIEYITLVVGVVAVMLLFYGDNQGFETTMRGLFQERKSDMMNMSGRLSGSYPLSCKEKNKACTKDSDCCSGLICWRGSSSCL